jgi:hypothetical protein
MERVPKRLYRKGEPHSPEWDVEVAECLSVMGALDDPDDGRVVTSAVTEYLHRRDRDPDPKTLYLVPEVITTAGDPADADVQRGIARWIVAYQGPDHDTAQTMIASEFYAGVLPRPAVRPGLMRRFFRRVGTPAPGEERDTVMAIFRDPSAVDRLVYWAGAHNPRAWMRLVSAGDKSYVGNRFELVPDPHRAPDGFDQAVWRLEALESAPPDQASAVMRVFNDEKANAALSALLYDRPIHSAYADQWARALAAACSLPPRRAEQLLRELAENDVPFTVLSWIAISPRPLLAAANLPPQRWSRTGPLNEALPLAEGLLLVAEFDAQSHELGPLEPRLAGLPEHERVALVSGLGGIVAHLPQRTKVLKAVALAIDAATIASWEPIPPSESASSRRVRLLVQEAARVFQGIDPGWVTRCSDLLDAVQTGAEPERLEALSSNVLQGTRLAPELGGYPENSALTDVGDYTRTERFALKAAAETLRKGGHQPPKKKLL